MRRLMGVVVAALLVAGACSNDDSSGATAPTSTVDAEGRVAGPSASQVLTGLPVADPAHGPGTLDWEPCEPEGVSLCATAPVPLDHARPDGDSIDLAVELVPATDREARQGVIWWNPGGPGMPGVSNTGGVASEVPDELLAAYDIATFDPRGIGRSAPLDCGPEPDRSGLDDSPDDEAEVAAVLAAARLTAEACASVTPEVLPHLGTQSVANDLDLLRQAVGDERLHYIGMSYGTVIGQQYLAIFPETSGLIVLDGVVDVAVDWEQRWTDMAEGRELAFQRFLDWCAAEETCVFNSEGDPAGAFTSLYTALDADPIVLPDETLDRAGLEGELSQALYGGERSWPGIARSLALYRDRDVECLADLDCRVGLDPAPDEEGETDTDDGFDGFDGELDEDFEEAYADGAANLSDPFDAVTCVDWAKPRDPAEFARAAERIAGAAPIFGRILSWAQAPCIFWAAEPAGLSVPVAGDGPVPLVLSTSHDPATPLKHARSVAERLGAPVLVVDSARHVIFPTGESCLDDRVVAYFLDGALPDAATCPMPVTD